MENNNGYITVNEAAEMFRVDTETIYRWLKAGTIPGIKIGGAWRMKRSELEALWNNK